MSEVTSGGTVRTWVDRHRLAAFLLVTYGFTWTVQGAVAASSMERKA